VNRNIARRAKLSQPDGQVLGASVRLEGKWFYGEVGRVTWAA